MSILTALSTVFRRLATWRVLIATGTLFVAASAAMFVSSLPFAIPVVTALCGAEPPDVRFFTAGGEVRRFLAECGDAGVRAYRNLQLADLGYPAISALFLASALALVLTRLTRPGSRWIALAALPLLGGAFDYLENVAAWTALGAFPGDARVATELLGVMSILKQTVTWAAWVALLVTLSCLLVHLGRRQRARRNLAGGPGSASTTHEEVLAPDAPAL